MTTASFDIAMGHYITFLQKYATKHTYDGRSYTHSLPSSFIYALIKDNCIWLFNLLVGVAGYSIYFDKDTEASKVITLEMLDKAGVKDPCLTYKSTITPWTGLISSGKSPFSPVDKVVTGVGIAHFNKGGLPPFYKADTLTCVLPVVKDKDIVRDSKGIMQTTTYTVTYQGKPVRGWGMSYGDKRLSFDVVTNTTENLSYYTSDSRVCLKGKPSMYKLIGPDYGKTISGNTYMTKIEATQFIDWCKYHLYDSIDQIYPPLLWMTKYWAPFYSWHNGTQENSIQACMLASSIYNSGGSSKSDLNGASTEVMIENYVNGAKPSEREHRQRRILNTQRAIALLEFVKRV